MGSRKKRTETMIVNPMFLPVLELKTHLIGGFLNSFKNKSFVTLLTEDHFKSKPLEPAHKQPPLCYNA